MELPHEALDVHGDRAAPRGEALQREARSRAAARMKLRLVNDWRDWWKWYSTHATLFNVAMISAWRELPAEWQSSIPLSLVLTLAVIALVLGFVGRLIEQTRPEQKP